MNDYFFLAHNQKTNVLHLRDNAHNVAIELPIGTLWDISSGKGTVTGDLDFRCEITLRMSEMSNLCPSTYFY